MDRVLELARIERNRYNREWRARNKERVKEYNRKHWIKVALERAQKEKEAANDEQR